MNILIFGAGAIGCHIGYCMHKTGHSVNLICKGQHYDAMKEQGLRIKVFDNQTLEDERVIREQVNFRILNDLSQVDNVEFDYIFITVKLTDYNKETLNKLSPYMGENTAVIPPCTKMPFWWFFNLDEENNKKYGEIDFDPQISKYLKRENIIMMTMWLSAVVERPGHVIIKHTQRGYPLGPVYPKMVEAAQKLRKIFIATCMSPDIADIRSEIFIKSINAFAFNAVAVDKEFNNLQLSQDQDSKDSIRKIMEEADQILITMNLPILQAIDERITQTLSSTHHTMSMLHDYRIGKPIEIGHIWDCFYPIAKTLGIRMDYSEQIVKKVLEKTNNSK